MHRRNRLLISVGFSLLMLTGCTAAIIGGAAVGGYQLGKDSRSMEQVATDARITASVKSALIRNETIRARDINVDTFDNTVTLNGHVENRAEYKLAKELAAAIKGVESVDSRLKIVGVEVKDESI